MALCNGRVAPSVLEFDFAFGTSGSTHSGNLADLVTLSWHFSFELDVQGLSGSHKTTANEQQSAILETQSGLDLQVTPLAFGQTYDMLRSVILLKLGISC